MRKDTAREASADEPALDLRVVLEAQQDASVGTLFVERGGVLTSRDVPPAPCAEVADSLALMIALLLDGSTNADTAPAAPAADNTAADSAEASGAVASVNAESKQKERQQTVRVSPSPGEASRDEATEDRSERSRSKPLPLRFGVAVAGGVETGAAPSLLPTVSADLDGWLAQSGWWSPSVRVGVVYGGPASASRTLNDLPGMTTLPAEAVDYRLLALRASACPVRYPNASFSVRACAVADFGELRVRANISGGHTETMTWIGVGAGLRAEQSLGRFVSVEGGFALQGLLHADRFIFHLESGDQLVHQVPRATFGASIGVVARLP